MTTTPDEIDESGDTWSKCWKDRLLVIPAVEDVVFNMKFFLYENDEESDVLSDVMVNITACSCNGIAGNFHSNPDGIALPLNACPCVNTGEDYTLQYVENWFNRNNGVVGKYNIAIDDINVGYLDETIGNNIVSTIITDE